jgi:hypothetical protein
MFTTRLLAAAAFAAVMCVPAYADDASTPLTEHSVLPQYNQLPQNYEEFAAIYNKVLAALRDAGVQSIHKCFPAGTTPSEPHGWCQDKMKLPDRKGGYFSAVEIQRDDGKLINEVCLSDNSAEQRCFRNDGIVVDQALDKKTDIYTTYRQIAGAWNERGKPLSDLKPNAPNPPEATPRPPEAAAPSPPTPDDIRSQFTQIPNDYDEFTSGYNKVLAFLHDAGVQPIRRCFRPGDDPSNPSHGWCNNMMRWSNPKGEHISAGESQQDDGLTNNAIPLTDLKPRAPSLPAVTPSPPAAPTSPPAAPASPPAEQSPPAATSVLPPKYDHIPNSYDEFIAAYNNALAFLRDHGNGSTHKCFPPRSDPGDPHGWCQDVMLWANPNGQHITAADVTQDNGNHVVQVCSGDDMNTQRCYRDNGAVVDQSLNRRINLWVTFRQVAGAWNERGKALSDLKPRGNRNIKR